MTAPIGRRASAAIVALTPAALAAALLSHPHIAGRLPNHGAVAEAVVTDPGRWAMAHLAAGIAAGLVAVAFVFVARYLHEAGENRWSHFGLPWIVLGSVLYGLLPGLEFAPWAAATTAGDVVAAQTAIGAWFFPVFLAAGACFATGAVAFAASVLQGKVLGQGATIVVAVALVGFGLSRLAPYMAVQMYVQSAAAVAVFWPVAVAMWRGQLPATPERTPSPTARAADGRALAAKEVRS
jgi:hypothetical protein